MMMASRKKTRLSPLERKKYRAFYLIMAPFILLFLLYRLFPMAWGVYISFTNYSGFNINNLKFVELDNYKHVFEDSQAFSSLGRTVLIGIVVIPLTIIICNTMAIFLSMKFKGVGVFRTFFYMVIRGNHVSDCWGDGIILFNDKKGLIEHNVAANNGRSADLTEYYAGIWCIWSEDCLIQYNESYGQGASGDGQGFDIDGGCSGTIVQYNYSHDNYGGFILCMQWRNGEATIRYNVSINDSGSFLKYGYSLGEDPLMRLDVYNNTYFTTKPIMN